MHYLPEFLTIAIVDFLAILSPGVATVLTIRNSLKYSRKTVIFSSIGLGLGIIVVVAISLLGTSLLISKSGPFFSTIKFIGAGYLAYLGYKSVTDTSNLQKNDNVIKAKDPTALTAIKMGFITDVTNVNAYLFFLSLFTLIVSKTTPLGVKTLYGMEMAFAEFVCFATLGTIISHQFVKQRLGKFQLLVEKVMGIILIILATKIIFS